MEVKDSYENLLLSIINHEDNDIEKHHSHIEINTYITLLSLSNYYYPSEKLSQKHAILEDFLRKLNNLKVKIQLKRKQQEIDKLSEELLKVYHENKQNISKYNKTNLAIDKIITDKDPKDLTSLIDNLTKSKMDLDLKQEKYNNIRSIIFEKHQNISYSIQENTVYISEDNKVILKITREEFKEIFSYLLDSDNYKDIYSNSTSNTCRREIIKLLIESLNTNDYEKTIIPLSLTYIFNQENTTYDDLDMISFNIENIKISDLNSFGTKDKNNKNAKWKNISISNQYLYSKLTLLVKNGMYYQNKENIVFENNHNDFKVSINYQKLLDFLNQILTKQTNNKARTR